MDTPKAFRTRLRQGFWLSAIPLDATAPYLPVWVTVFGGTGLGLVWGIAARLWMRLIATQPAFSLPGTAAILMIATVFGAWTGLAFVARRRGWRRWGHYLPRGLVVVFFLPFGIAGGLPLMITVLLTTLAVTHTVVIGLWVLAVLAILLFVGTDIGLPLIVVVIAPVGAAALTVWKWLMPYWQVRPWGLGVDTWLERLGRTILLLLAALGFGVVAKEILTAKPGVLAAVYILCYITLLYPLFLALRVGLAPRGNSS